MNRQHIGPLLEQVRVLGDVELFEADGRQIVVIALGPGVPGGRAAEELPTDLDAVEIGDEPIIVPHPQGHVVEFARIAQEAEGDADVTARVAARHRLAHVDAEERLVAGAVFIAHSAGSADPSGIVERATALPGVIDGTGRHEHALRGRVGDDRHAVYRRRRRLGRARVRPIERVVHHAAAGRVDKTHLTQGFQVAAVGHDLGRRDELPVHPGASAEQPVLEMIDFALEAAVARPPVGPALEIASLRLPDLFRHPVDRRFQALRAEGAATQGEPPVDILLPEVDVLEESVPPDIVEIVGAVAGAMPAFGIVVASVRRIQSAVKIPQGAHFQFAVASLVQVRAQA